MPVVAPVVAPVVDNMDESPPTEEPEFIPEESVCGTTAPENGSVCENPNINCIFYFNNDPTTSITLAEQCTCNVNMIWECGSFVGGVGAVFSDDEVFVPVPTPVVPVPAPVPAPTPDVTTNDVVVVGPPVLVTLPPLSNTDCAPSLPTTLGLAATTCGLSPSQICCYGVQLASATICTCTGNQNGRSTYVCVAGLASECPDIQNPNIITSPPVASPLQ